MAGVHGYSKSLESGRAFRRAMWIVGLRLALPPLLIAASDVTGMYRGVASLLLIAPLLELFRHVRYWALYVRTFGLPPLEHFRIMRATEEMRAHNAGTGASAPSWSFVRVFASMAAGSTLVFLAWGFTRWLIVLYLAVSMLMATIKFAIRRLRPPVVLVLGASGDRASALLSALQGVSAPFTTANMLRYENDSADIVEAMNFYSYRTLDPMWQASVANLVRCAQIIVIDTRRSTTALEFEMGLIASAADRVLIVGPPSSGSSHSWMPAGEVIERVRAHIHGPYQKTSSLARSWFHDSTNHYFKIRAPHKWRAELHRDVRSRVTFRHPSSIGVELTVLARATPANERFPLGVDYGEFASLYPGAQIEQRRSTCAGRPAVDVEVHDDSNVGHGLTRIIDFGGRRVTLSFGAPTRRLYDEFVGIVLKSFDTLTALETVTDPLAHSTHAVANRIRKAQLVVDRVGPETALQMLQAALAEFPESADIRAEIGRVEKLRRENRGG